MKKSVSVILLMLMCTFTFAQKFIENPEYGLSKYPGEITKIEIQDTTTVLHFKIKKLRWGYFHILKESYIQDLSGDNKLFVTKVTGAKFKRNDFPPSGEVTYQLYFPPIDKTAKTIDFGVEKERGWHVYDIVLLEDENSLSIPKELRGNWLLADGSNRWDYGFNSKNAIIESAIWNYKSIDKKENKYAISLVSNGKTKTVYAKLNKNGRVDFGNSAKSLKTYSLEKVNNPAFKLANDVLYTDSNLFKIDFTTYSGVVKNYTPRAQQKTGMIYVNDIFVGEQVSHLLKIADDGSFSVKLPINYPQSILVRIANSNTSVFVEPGKEIFHYIDGGDSLFMGNLAQVNSDLNALNEIKYFDYKIIRDSIGILSPKDYKAICLDARDKELKALDAYKSSNFLSVKAHQIKKLEINYGALVKASGYEMYRGSLKRSNEKAKSKKKKKAYKAFEVDESYYDFLTKDFIDNKLAVLSNEFYILINRIAYAKIFKENERSVYSSTIADIGDWLQKNNKELSVDELAMIEMSKEIETPEVLKKQEAFRKVHGKVQQAFYKKYMKDYQDFLKENKDESESDTPFMLRMADYSKKKGAVLLDEEILMLEAIKTLKTPEEEEKERGFNSEYGKVRMAFYKKHNHIITDIARDRMASKKHNRMKNFFGVSDAFLFDILKLHDANKKLNDFEVYDSGELKQLQNEFNEPIFADYLAIANKRTAEKIETNRTKGGYTINTVQKSEGDELFDAMLKKFRGKVVYVDFWATWCGPCKSGIKKIEPLKEEMKDEDVVFLYVTNQTSPEKTWKNAIPNINGEHFRVSADEWNYLADKFKITGIPHYTLVNKKGEVVKQKMKYTPNSKLKQIFQAELSK